MSSLSDVNQNRMSRRQGPAVLIICDGWGVGATDPATVKQHGNAVAMARTPVRDQLLREFPWCLLTASGAPVGLPAGQMGNSEVGHLNLGAGRIVHQDITRISASIQEGGFFELPELNALAASLRRSGGRLHLVGLCSDGGVHSHIDHLFALVDWAKRARIPVDIHCITDGRDAPPKAGLGCIRDLEQRLAQGAQGTGASRIATVTGRYFAMDRDRRWSRTEQACRAIAEGTGRRVARASDYIAQCYAGGVTDEFLPAAVVAPHGNGPGAEANRARPPGIGAGDAVLSFNFRADRARQIVAALASPDFAGFRRNRKRCKNLVAMTRYTDDFAHPVLFPRKVLKNVLGEVLSRTGRTQLRMAETEKYAHVTYFFNGGEEKPFPGEDRHVVPSPNVATYDLQPEMSALELTEALLDRLEERRHDFVLVNYANPDVVGHTGSIRATITAVETVDACVGRVVARVRSLNGTALVTADHGNAERMIDEDGGPLTAHTTSPVRLILAGHDALKSGGAALRDGILADVAPTVLDLTGVPVPAEMTGSSLLSVRGKP